MNLVVRRLRRRDEEGSALVLALFFAFIFSLLVTAILTFTDTGLRSSKAYRAKRLAALGPEAAMEAAIQSRAMGGPCDDSTQSPSNDDDTPVGGDELVVRCQNLTGVSDLVSTGSASLPRTALLALGSDPAEGIVTGTGETRVRGDVFSQSRIDTSGSFVVEGRASAIGDCTPPPPSPSIRTETNPGVPPRCANSPAPPFADPVQGRDPDFTKSASTVPIRRSVPGCGSGTGEGDWLITMLPGYYDDAAALETLTTGGACPGRVVWFQPGTYYLNFGFATGTDTVWTITDPTVDVVGGQPRNWSSEAERVVDDGVLINGDPTVTSDTADFSAADVGRSVSGVSVQAGSTIVSVTDAQTVELSLPPTADATAVVLTITAPRPDLPVPGSCLATGDAGYDDGVEMIVGGHSRIQINDGAMELCAPPRGTEQQIGLYGMGPGRGAHTLEPTEVIPTTASPRTDFSDPHRAFTPGEAEESAAAATLSAGQPGPAMVTLGTFRQSIPSNAVIDSAVLRVAHRETGDVGTVRVTPSGCGAQVLTANTELAEDTVDLKGLCGIDTPADFDGLSVFYEVTSLGGGSFDVDSELDAIVIDVAYREAITRKPTVATSADFTNQTNALEIGEVPASTADVALDGSTPTASVSLTGFADPPVPAGYTIDAAVLRVAHAELGPDPIEASVTVAFPSSTCSGPQVLGSSTSVTEETLDLIVDCGLSDPSELAGLAVEYTAALTTGGAADAQLDGVWLDLLYSTTRDPNSSVGGDFATNEASGAEIEGTSAVADLSGGGDTASITVDGNWDAAIPSDAIIDTARLRIRHRDEGDIDPQGITVTPSFAGNTCTDVSLTLRREILVDDFVDLKSCGLDTPGALSNLSVLYEATLEASGVSGTARLDGMQLLLSYRPHTSRGPTAVGPETGFDSPESDGLVIGGDTTEAALTTGAPTASIRVDGFGSPALPSTAVVDSAILRIRHQEDDDVEATLTLAGCGTPQDLTESLTLADEEVDLFADCATALDTPAAINALTATFDVSLTPPTPSGLAHLDGMVLEVVFRTPAFEPLAGCVTEVPYPTPGCALVKSSGATARFVVNGTIYAPSAALDLEMQNVEGSVVTRGAVARTIRLNVTSVGNRPVIGIPPESALFTVYARHNDQPASATSAPGHFSNPTDGTVIDTTSATSTLDDPGASYVRNATTVDTDSGNWDVATKALLIDADPAVATLAATGDDTSITVSGMGTPAIPPGAILDSAILTVEYETGTDPDVGVTVTPSGCDVPTLPLPARPTLGPETLDLSLPGTCNFDDPTELDGLAVGFEATLTGAGPTTVRLDGMSLEVTYRLTASMSVTDFDASDLDPSTPLDAAVLRVAHGFDNPGDVESVTITANGTGTACDNLALNAAIPTSSSIAAVSVDLMPCGVATVGDLDGLSVTYTVTLKPNVDGVTTSLDGIELELFSGPLLRAQVTYQGNRATVEGWSVLT